MATIKKGTYRFNDVLTTGEITENINFTVKNEFVMTDELPAVSGIPAGTYLAVIDARNIEIEITSEYGWFSYNDCTFNFYNSNNESVYEESDNGYVAWDYQSGWLDDVFFTDFQTITVPYDQEVTPDFAEWFNANTVEVVEHTISGVWKFNDVLVFPQDSIVEDVNFSVKLTYNGFNCVAYCEEAYVDSVEEEVSARCHHVEPETEGLGEGVGFGYFDGSWSWDTWGDVVNIFDFGTEPQTVSAEFYKWLIANAKPLTTITYNGNVIASFQCGTKAIRCNGAVMQDDIVITVPEMGGGDTPADGEDWIGDGNTHIWISLTEDRKSPMLGVCPKGTVTVDWGDGSTPDVLTGTSTSIVKWTPTHNYAAAGDYVITLTVSGEVGFMGNASRSKLLGFSSTDDNRSRAYSLAIKKIEMGNGVTSIGSYAFFSLSALISVSIPNSVTRIGDYAFRCCYSLKNINIPNSVTSIGNYAFNQCYGLQSISIPNSVTSIGNSAFEDCRSLLSITIPDGVKSIGEKLCYTCYALTNVNVPDSVKSIGSYAFSHCHSLLTINIPAGVTSIGDYAFSYCFALASISIPAGVTSISSVAFGSCYSFASINIPNSVTSIGERAFDFCYALTSISIPSSVKSIGINAFGYCYSLAKMRFDGTTPPTVSNSNAFSNIPTDCVISVPIGSLNAYKTAANYPSPSTYTYVEE